MAISVRFQIGGHNATDWTGGNPVLLAREFAAELDTGKFKIGDGATAWNSLPYITFWSSFGRLGGAVGDNAALASALAGKQADDATLTALAAYNTDGILTQTAADTFAGRTITGTANEITVTNGSGVGGNPTLSLPAALTFTGKTITGGTITGLSSLGVSGTVTITGASIQLDNAQYVRGKIAAGTQTRMLGINASDSLFIGSIDASIGSVVITGGATWATFSSSGLNIPTGFTYKINNVQVVAARKTGWATATGTADRTTYATYTAPTISNPPTQAEVQAIADHVQILSRHLKALIDDLHGTAGHGLIGT